MNKKTIKDIDLKGKRYFAVLILTFRCRMEKLQMIPESGCSSNHSILTGTRSKSYFCQSPWRPKGEVVEELRLTPVAKQIS